MKILFLIFDYIGDGGDGDDDDGDEDDGYVLSGVSSVIFCGFSIFNCEWTKAKVRPASDYHVKAQARKTKHVKNKGETGRLCNTKTGSNLQIIYIHQGEWFWFWSCFVFNILADQNFDCSKVSISPNSRAH